ncbi:MAG: phage coat protein [Clostridia bacterium]|nr:phage coat protein [Clostridia bacterium]
MPQFDSKIFNAEVFGRYLERIPRVKQNKLLEAGVMRTRGELKTMLADQTGGNYITVPMLGLIDGEPLNYDGATDVTATSTRTYSQSMVVTGRMKAWQEKDFSADITGTDFMDNVAAQVAAYWDDVDQDTLLSILKGIFSMTGAGNLAFVNGHTLDISAETEPVVGPTTLNTAIQKAAGDNKGIFKLVICHSAVATNLENLSAVEYLKYTDKKGVERALGMATWNGRLLLIDDSVPSEAAESDTIYTSYILGDGAFDYCDCGAKVPNEMWRDPKTAGGVEVLITRQRKLFAPRGISFTKASMTSLSPTGAELETGANWTLVHDDQSSKSYINHKAIPIARILSKG